MPGWVESNSGSILKINNLPRSPLCMTAMILLLMQLFTDLGLIKLEFVFLSFCFILLDFASHRICHKRVRVADYLDDQKHVKVADHLGDLASMADQLVDLVLFSLLLIYLMMELW